MRVTERRTDGEPERPRPVPAVPGPDVLALQRTAGNAAVSRMLARTTVTDETTGEELQPVTNADLFRHLPPRVRRMFARLPAHLQQGFTRLPQDVQQRLLLLDEDQQEAILRLPPALLGMLLTQAAQPLPMLEAPPERRIVPAGPVRDATPREPKLPEGLLDFLMGRAPMFNIDFAALLGMRITLPFVPLAVHGPSLPPERLHQPSGNDPLLQAGRAYLEAGGAEKEVRWALRKCGGDAEHARLVLGFLLEYIGSPLLAQAKLELERAHGDGRTARAKLAAVKRMQTEQTTRAKESAQAIYDTESADLAIQKEDEELPLRKDEQKKRPRRNQGGRRGQTQQTAKVPQKTPMQVHQEKYTALEQDLESQRGEREAKGTERNVSALLALTGQQDSHQVEVLLHATKGDVQLLTKLAPTLRLAGPDADVLASALVSSGSAEKLAPRCGELLANGEASVWTAVTVAQFMFDVPAPEAQQWARRNGHGIRKLKSEMQFLIAHKKFAKTAVCALDALGLFGAADLTEIFHLGTPLEWCIVNLSGADRKAALVLVRNHPEECQPLCNILQRNTTAGAKQKPNAALIDALKKYSGAKYDVVHQHFVTTATCTDIVFKEILEHVYKGHTLQSALHWMAQTEVAVPQGVAVHGWVELNPNGMVRYPMAFSKGGYHTDQVCIKHYEEFEHANDQNNTVPVARMQNYFADLVAACDAAHLKWIQDKPAVGQSTSYAGRPNGLGRWFIKVKTTSDKKPEIFHVDSGYENSYWRTHNT